MSKSPVELALAAKQSKAAEIVELNNSAERVRTEIAQIETTIDEINASLAQALSEAPDLRQLELSHRRALAGFEIGQVTAQELDAVSGGLNEKKREAEAIALKNSAATQRCRETIAGLEEMRASHSAEEASIAKALHKASMEFVLLEASWARV